ncbi:MAG: UDP-N-acetylmuramoyl-L-alanine--D-glutamate ligase [Bacillota bacterium]
MSQLPVVVPHPDDRVAVVGLGVSNRAVASYLLDLGISPHYYDAKNPRDLDLATLPEDPGDRLYGGADYLQALARDHRRNPYRFVFVTPGMPKHHPVLRSMAGEGVRLAGEMGFFMDLCPAGMVGITGSAGKTTTASMLAHFLGGLNRRVWLGGNIGRPMIDRLGEIEGDDLVVLELSSFQLELANTVPQTAALLNMFPDHLDVHENLEAYYEAKANLVKNQRRGDRLLLNRDCPRSAALAEVSRADVSYFSLRLPGTADSTTVAYLRGDELVLREGEHEEEFATRGELPLAGDHNVANALAAAALARGLGVPIEHIRRSLRDFVPPPHRLETVGEVGGVRYVNDSIATSPGRARAALMALEGPLVVILGGYDKGVSFEDLARRLRTKIDRDEIRGVVLTGASASRIAVALGEAGVSEDSLLVRRDFDEAVAAAAGIARPKDTVLLSPGCASFDSFGNYRRRGEHFRVLVERMKGANEV